MTLGYTHLTLICLSLLQAEGLSVLLAVTQLLSQELCQVGDNVWVKGPVWLWFPGHEGEGTLVFQRVLTVLLPLLPDRGPRYYLRNM